MNRQDEFDSQDNRSSSAMMEYYRNKVVLLTGGTGFLGQLFVEKLLRCGVKKIYLISRSKKGKTPEERMKEIFSGPHFKKLYREDNNYISRLKFIEGNLMELQLGISSTDLKDIEENCEIVIHSAAEVRFMETLSDVILNNVRGTRELLRIAQCLKKLEVFTYISTAYSNCCYKNIKEQFYDPPIDPSILIKYAERFQNDPTQLANILEKRIIMPWPNTYAYSKAIAEGLVRSFGTLLPICVIRPPIVISTWREPIPGWSNTIFGINGILVGVGIGILRPLFLSEKKKPSLICADIVINFTLTAIFSTHNNHIADQQKGPGSEATAKDPEVYNITPTKDVMISWETLLNVLPPLVTSNPPTKAFRRANAMATESDLLFKLLTLYHHVLIALLLDFVQRLRNKKFRLLPIYRKVANLGAALKFFMTSEFHFTTSNTESIVDRMSEADKEFFPCDVRQFNWDDYYYDFVLGMGIYVVKENYEDISKSRKNYRKFEYMHNIEQGIYHLVYAGLVYFVLNWLKIPQYASDAWNSYIGHVF